MDQMKEYQYRSEIKKYREEIEQLKAQNVHLNLDMQSVRDDFGKVLQSKSWKVTKPLRYVTNKISKKESAKVESFPSSNVYSYDYHEVPSYVSEYQENISFEGITPLVKTIAFYLPQYHSIPENDKWWGKDFTEWTNTKKSKPLFDGHYMPREPHDDFGYYNLEDVEVLKKQVNLAKQHGLYGFAFYYYWFSGKRLLEKPLDLLLSHPEIDFPFILCWANENWTRTWDGLENEVLIKQDYLDEDPYNFISDLKKYVDDERYIKVDGKPVIMVYNPKAIPDFATVCEKWRVAARNLGIGEIIIWSKTEVALNDDRNSPFVDGEFDFAPHGFCLPGDQITGISNVSNIVNYSKLVQNLWDTYENHYPTRPFQYSVMMGWDNSARRQKGFKIYYNYSLEAFYLWTQIVMKKLKQNDFDNTFLFVNAWNEWGEGTYLEPDKRYGYANINTLSKAICGIPFHASFKVIHGVHKNIVQGASLAIQCHVYYVDLLESILKQLAYIPVSYDLYISTDSTDKKKEIVKILKEYKITKYHVQVFENRGRDILPMLLQMKDHISKYDYFLHLHTKKSKTLDNGQEWRKYLFSNLLGSKSNVNAILSHFAKNEKLGLVYPIPHPASYWQLINPNGAVGGNRKLLERLFSYYGLSLDDINPFMTFPHGSMFWARVDAIQELFSSFEEDQFDEEKGQLDQTYAHAIERIFDVLARKNGYEVLETLND